MKTLGYSTTMSSQGHRKLAKIWLDECIQKHPNCPQPSQGFAPSRLLAIVLVCQLEIGDLVEFGLIVVKVEGDEK
jgi:hypothetical protein